ncbi:hypothetical protein SKAU_G00401970 [Synaphobranchus kaupii]|uniref:Uncharacterized protein n=1 Tax=Synaphobranchus kaupii TaxID=118154 RepID=A0A9Q1IAG1_SYNKA|nr:hypothetical protein SKAU_G00401970 [Synaphobranchus kaupii]
MLVLGDLHPLRILGIRDPAQHPCPLKIRGITPTGSEDLFEREGLHHQKTACDAWVRAKNPIKQSEIPDKIVVTVRDAHRLSTKDALCASPLDYYTEKENSRTIYSR